MRDLFASTSEAFRNARRRASVAASLERQLLHTAVYDAREQGLSIRQAADALHVPKSTVARHWRAGHSCVTAPPAWGDETEWMAAERSVWAHDPSNAPELSPWVWTDNEDGTRSVQARPTGIAVRRDPA